MSNEELKKTLESMQNLRLELSTSKVKTLAFLIEAGILTPEGNLRVNSE